MAAKKVSLTDLLNRSDPDEVPTEEPANTPEAIEESAPQQAPISAVQAPPAPVEHARPVGRKQRSPKKSIPTEPKYLRLERKETRIRADQYQELTELSRSLNRARRGQGERITENTLIRVAVDLLLERHRNELSGTDESELSKSVGL